MNAISGRMCFGLRPHPAARRLDLRFWVELAFAFIPPLCARAAQSPRWHRFKSYQTRITSESAANHDSALMKFPSGPIKQWEKFFFFLFLLSTSSRRAVRNRIMHNSLILFIYCLSRFGYRSPCGELFSIIQRAISAAKKVYLDSISLASYRHHVKASRTWVLERNLLPCRVRAKQFKEPEEPRSIASWFIASSWLLIILSKSSSSHVRVPGEAVVNFGKLIWAFIGRDSI